MVSEARLALLVSMRLDFFMSFSFSSFKTAAAEFSV